MQTTRTTVPGLGSIHECHTRDGGWFRVVGERGGARRLIVFEPSEDPVVRLDADEAEQLADLLRGRSTRDRVAALERRIAALADSIAGAERRA